MNSWAQLPAEITQAIFCRISKPSEFIQLQLVCRNWGIIAQQNLYHNVFLEANTVLELYTRTITTASNIGQLTKIIDFGASTSRAISEAIPTLSHHCPCLTHIFVKYPQIDFYYSLLLALSEHRFQFLEYVPTSTGPFSIEKYYEIVIALRQRLTVLRLEDHSQGHITPNSIILFKKIANQLLDFPRLTTLEIHRDTNKSIMQFDKLIQDCPLLDSLHVYIFNIYDQQIDERKHILDDFDYAVPLDLTQIVPRPHIKAIKNSRFVFYSDQDIQYLVHKFPLLHSFELRTDVYSRLKMVEFGKRISIDATVELFTYIAHIPQHQVTDLIFENFALVLTRFLDNVNIPLRIHFCYEILGSSIYQNNSGLPTINFERQGKQEIGNVMLKKMFCNASEIELEEYILPFIEFLENAGQFVQHLEVHYLPKEAANRYFNMNDILPHCPNLGALYLNGERISIPMGRIARF
jgi:hypothetical protein